MKKQIFLFTEKGIAAFYGIGTYISNLVDLLSQEDHFEVTVIELLSDRTEVEDIDVKGVRYLYIPKAENEIKQSYYRNIFFILHHYINKNQTQIFHLNFMSCKKLADTLKSHYPQAKIILTIHYSVCGMNRFATNEIEEDEKEYINEYCDMVIALSEHRYCFLIDEYKVSPTKIELLPHGIKDEYYSALHDNSYRSKLLGLNKERIILYVGRLDENKGIDLLIKSFKRVVCHLHDVHLVIVGEGVLLPSLLRDCKSILGKVTFTGFLDKEDVFKLYANASIGVIPSQYEELGFVALEMLMFGLPIIANDSTGLSDLLLDSKVGQLVNADRLKEDMAINSLTDAIIGLLNDEERQKQYRILAREHFSKKYTIEIFKDRMLEIYNS